MCWISNDSVLCTVNRIVHNITPLLLYHKSIFYTSLFLNYSIFYSFGDGIISLSLIKGEYYEKGRKFTERHGNRRLVNKL